MTKKTVLSGVDAETRKEIYKLRKDARDNAKVQRQKQVSSIEKSF